jgi:hypothetical protein
MSPRLFWLTALPLLALQPALSRAADAPLPLVVPPVAQKLREAGDLARQATQELLHSFEQLRQVIPQFGKPYFDDNCDLVIPRRHDPAAPPGVPIPFAGPRPA